MAFPGDPPKRWQQEIPLQHQASGQSIEIRAAAALLAAVNLDLDRIIRDQAIEAAVLRHLKVLGSEAKDVGLALLREVGPLVAAGLLESFKAKFQGR